jgi:hypothetical protein
MDNNINSINFNSATNARSDPTKENNFQELANLIRRAANAYRSVKNEAENTQSEHLHDFI